LTIVADELLDHAYFMLQQGYDVVSMIEKLTNKDV